MIEGLVIEGTTELTRETRAHIEHMMMNNWIHSKLGGVPEFYWCRPLDDNPLQIKWRCYLTISKP